MVRDVLEAHRPADAAEAGFKDRMLALCGTGAPFSRHQIPPGHFTASAYVLHPAQPQLLLIEHSVLRRWLQPGGHFEAGETPWQAARREVAEETGLQVRGEGTPFDLDIHPIPANDRKGEAAHEHFDLRFLVVATTEAAQAGSDAQAARWVSLEEAPSLLIDESAARVVAKIRASPPWW